jgi:uncharacterized protein (DUF362 family)/ferredoxin
MSHSTVALVRCASYNPDTVYTALQRGVELLGGLDRFVRPGERLLLKPNILAGDGPESAVTTHPSVLASCVRLFSQCGASLVFGDSPGMQNAQHAATRAGLLEAGLRAGATWGEFSSGRDLDNPGGALVQSFPIAQAIHDCDGIVNLPKMKTHQLTRLTGAVKNLFGCVPGQRKALYHVQFRDVTDFSALLVELSLRLRPRLHVLDGIVAMEGNGPRSGDPRPMNVLVLSTDPIAADATFARLAALDPAFMPTAMLGERMGLGQYQEGEIEVVGDALEAFIQPGFKVVRRPVLANASYAYYNSLKSLLLPRPVIDAARCTRCGQCVRACPVPDKAVRFNGHGREASPRYHYDLCIRCYCCQEMCPNGAIARQTPLLGQLLRVS